MLNPFLHSEMDSEQLKIMILVNLYEQKLVILVNLYGPI